MAFADTMAGLTPVAWWRLGEPNGSTSFADSSGNGHAATAVNTVASGAPGLVGDADTALALTDSSEYLQVPNGAWMAVSQFSVFAVANLANFVDYPELISAKSNGWFSLFVNSGGSAIFSVQQTSGAKTNATSPSPISTGTTHQLAGTYDGANVVLYIDGAQVASLPLAAALNNGGTPYITIGEFVNGTLDEVAFFDRALTASDVAALHDSATPAPPPPPATATSRTYRSDGYTYTGGGSVDFDPAVASAPAHLTRAKVKRVHQSLPAPTLVNGRPQ